MARRSAGAPRALRRHRSASQGGGGPGPECAVFDSTATLSPLDLFVMLDLSMSKSEVTARGFTKWQSVRNAIVGFLDDPDSAGTGLSLGIFPVPAQEDFCIPGHVECEDEMTGCTVRTVCGTPDVQCSSSFESPMGVGCGIEGISEDTGEPCYPSADIDCPKSTEECLPTGTCSGIDVCSAQRHVLRLQDVAALTLDLGIRTFAIGVFSPDDEPSFVENVQRIAVAGGTEEAIVIDTSDELTERFQQALNQIRLDAPACAFPFALGSGVDLDEVWVRIEDQGQERWIERCDDEAACDEAEGGFFSDPPAQPGDAAVRIVLCPSNCTFLGTTVSRQAEVYTECHDAVP